jgi:hypothetical protein
MASAGARALLGEETMLSWQAMILNGFFRFTMKRHGKKALNLGARNAA